MNSWAGKIPWRGDRLPTAVFLGFPGRSDSKESTCSVSDLGSVSGPGRSPGGGNGNALQYSCLENPYGQRSLTSYNPWGHKELDTTERLNTAHKNITLNIFTYGITHVVCLSCCLFALIFWKTLHINPSRAIWFFLMTTEYSLGWMNLLS